MSKEFTLGIIKPDAVRKNLIGTIIAMGEKEGLHVGGLRFVDLRKSDAEDFYAEHAGKPFYDELTTFMSSGPVVAICWEGEDAVAKWRKLMGATDPSKAEPGTIRALFGNKEGVIRENAVHGSADKFAAEIETAFFAP
jgi:nucleoside-diphosphate kinase